EPVRSWVATRATTFPAGRWPARDSLPLVGRDREVAALTRRIEAALAERRAAMVTIVGEAGVGKTRLAAELVDIVGHRTEPPQVIWVSCPPYGPGADLSPLVEIVRTGLDLPRSLDPEAQRAVLFSALEALGASRPDLLGARLLALMGLSPPTSRSVDIESGPVRGGVSDQQIASVFTVIELLATQRPLVLVVDDLHSGGSRLLRFLGQVPERLAELPILILGLAREDLLERQVATLDAAPGHDLWPLDPLDDDASAEFILALLGVYARPGEEPRMGPAALDRLVEVGGGSPLLIEQLVQFLVESRYLAEKDGRWHWTSGQEGSESGLPDGVRSLIGARLDALPVAERAVLAEAAVFGRTFWRDAVRDLSDEPEVDGLLDELDRRGFIERVVGSDQGDLAFRHVLTRDVAYASLPLAERADRHARVARWLEDRFGPHDHRGGVGQRAHHYERAVVLGHALDHTSPGLSRRAFDALVEAARDEYRHEGLRRSDHWYRRARDLGTLDPDAAIDALAEHGQVLLELRQLDDAKRTFEELVRQAGMHRPPLAALAVAHLGAVARLQGDQDGAREMFEIAVERWRNLNDLQGLADTYRLQGWSELTAGRHRAALPRLQQAAAIETQLDESVRRGETLRYLGWCEFVVGDLAAAQEHLWEALRWSSESDDFGAIGWCFGLLGHTMLQAGQAAQARNLAANLRAVSSSQSDPWGEWTCAILEAACLVALDEHHEALELSSQAELHMEEFDDTWGLALARVVRAQASRLSGDVVDARLVLERALAATKAADYVGEDARILAELARVEVEVGNHEAAEHQARGALALVRAGVGDHESGLRALLVLAEVAAAAGDGEGAELFLEEAVQPRDAPDRTEAWRQAALALADLRIDAGDLAGAAILVEACDDPPVETRSLLDGVARLRRRLEAP
ncbi:MAG: tetratricopeptide repeat protein, partial [Aquihabitans sp.]